VRRRNRCRAPEMFSSMNLICRGFTAAALMWELGHQAVPGPTPTAILEVGKSRTILLPHK